MITTKFAGSKKRAKALQREARIQAAFKKRIDRIYELSRLIKSEDELNLFLESILDDEVRAETKKLIEPFCLFKFKKITLIGGDLQTPEKATEMVIH